MPDLVEGQKYEEYVPQGSLPNGTEVKLKVSKLGPGMVDIPSGSQGSISKYNKDEDLYTITVMTPNYPTGASVVVKRNEIEEVSKEEMVSQTEVDKEKMPSHQQVKASIPEIASAVRNNLKRF